MKSRPQRRSGNFSALKVEIWASIREVAGVIADPETTPDLKVRALSAIAAAGGVYLRILERERQQTPADQPVLPGEIIVIHANHERNGHHT